jgi:glycosyltransferase involved in cell wall biosynthesis
MKVVHVTTVDSGGAATAAYRLHEGLVKAGVDSKFIVLYNINSWRDVITFRTPSSDFFGFLFRKVKYRMLRLTIDKHLTGFSREIEIFTSPYTIYNIAAHPVVKNADLIHFHWVANFVDYISFFKKNDKCLVWTFHDENPIYGGIHYKGDIVKLSLTLQRLENRFQTTKRNALSGAKCIWPICPSPWLLNEVASSPYHKIFENAKCIYYGIDHEKFTMLDRLQTRMELSLPVDKKLILLICSNLVIYRKGFDLFYELTKRLMDIHNVEFLVAGEISNFPFINYSRYVGLVSDPVKLVKLYNAVDATLIPSREDNLPNVMIESLTCGTPVLAFKIGGIQNVVDNNIDGLLATDVSVESLYNLVLEFLASNTFDREVIRRRAIARFDNRIQVEEVTKLYQECIQYNN